MWTRIGMVLTAVLASFVLTGAGQVSVGAGGPENRAAARAVAVVTGIEDGTAEDAVPAGFAEVMGYQPPVVTTADGLVRVLAPGGDCSSPFGATTYGFDRACQAHDYGYALLRYAAEQGGELGPWARVAIDDRFGADLRRRCADVDGGEACQTVAGLGEAVVKANSWRQGQGVPGAEESGPYLASGGLVLAAIAGPPVLAWLRRRRRRSGAQVSGKAALLPTVAGKAALPVNVSRRPAGPGEDTSRAVDRVAS